MVLPKNQKMLQEWQNRFPLENYFGFDINPYTSFVQYDSEATILEEGESKEVLYILWEGKNLRFPCQRKSYARQFCRRPLLFGRNGIAWDQKKMQRSGGHYIVCLLRSSVFSMQRDAVE